MKASLLSLVLPILATLVAATPTPGVAPLHVPDAAFDDLIPDQYTVVLKDDTPIDAFNSHVSFVEVAAQSSPLWGENGLRHVWDGSLLKGYSGRFSEEVLDMIRRRPEVDYVEQVQVVRVAEVQEKATWGLARISHREKVERHGEYEYEYLGDEPGAGVRAYVIDTGIRLTHQEFEGRAEWGTTVVKGPDTDDHGHGTHVAGTVGGKTLGVSKKVQLVAVKVFDHSGAGTSDDILQGLVWADKDATEHALQAATEIRATGTSSHKGSVINMSLTVLHSVALSQAAKKVIAHGHTIVVAAGNLGQKACNYSPADVAEAITVGATNIVDMRWARSNWGDCVDLFAPGAEILSADPHSDTARFIRSGTSMAAPHVTGVIAYLMSIYPHPTFDPKVAAGAQGRLVDAYAVAYKLLPAFATRVLPDPEQFRQVESVEVAQDLSPAQLKKALMEIATWGAIDDTMSPNNALLFNNATSDSLQYWLNKNTWSFA